MDSLTRSVVRCLQWPLGEDMAYGLRPTYWAISKKLRVSPKVVKARLEALTKAGVVTHVRVVPDVSFFGLRKTGVMALMSGTVMEKMREKLPLFDFVESAHMVRGYQIPGEMSQYGRPFDSYFVRLDIIHKRGEDTGRAVRILQSAFGDFFLVYNTTFVSRGRGPPPSRKMAILRELVRRPFAGTHALADAASVSEGSVRKYLGELARAKAFYFEPVIDSTRMDSTAFMVAVPTEARRRDAVIVKLKERLTENWLLENVGSESMAGMVCVANNLAEAERLYASLRSDDELEGAIMLLGVESLDNQPNVSYLKR